MNILFIQSKHQTLRNTTILSKCICIFIGKIIISNKINKKVLTKTKFFEKSRIRHIEINFSLLEFFSRLCYLYHNIFMKMQKLILAIFLYKCHWINNLFLFTLYVCIAFD